MSKTSFLLIILLLFLLGSFLSIIYLSPFKFLSTLPENFFEKKLPSSTQSYILSFHPQPIQNSQTLKVEVQIETQDVLPDVIQLEIGYDPTVLTAVEVLPGDIFLNPTIPLNRLSLAGRISYALTCEDLSPTTSPCINQGAKKVATITFLTPRSIITKETLISFLPKTLIQTTNGEKTSLTTHNIKVSIPGFSVPQATISGALNPIR